MTRSKQLSVARALLKEKMAHAGIDRLILPSIETNPEAWLPLGLIARRQPSPVRVTRKGVPKYQRHFEDRQSVHKGDHRTPPDWWTRKVR
jgi:hypothetical protein